MKIDIWKRSRVGPRNVFWELVRPTHGRDNGEWACLDHTFLHSVSALRN